MSSLSSAQLTEKFASVTAARRAQLSAMSDDDFATPVMTPVGPGTYGRFMNVRVFDFWVHEQDIRTPLELPGHEGGPAAERSIDEIRMSMPYIAGKRVGVPDGDSLRVHLTGPVAGDITRAGSMGVQTLSMTQMRPQRRLLPIQRHSLYLPADGLIHNPASTLVISHGVATS